VAEAEGRAPEWLPAGAVVADAAVPARLRPLPRSARLRGWLESDLERGAGFPWLAVAFAVGAALYFAWPVEPSPALAVALAVLLVAAAILARRRSLPFRLLVLAAALACGFAGATLRTAAVDAPVLAEPRNTTLTGFIEQAEARPAGAWRLTIRPVAMTGFSPEEMPRAVQLTVRGAGAVVTPGAAVEVGASLTPPYGPVLPGGYDFGRVSYYRGVGATGFSYGATRPAEGLGPPFGMRITAAVQRLRAGIAARIRAVLPGDTGAIAAALIMGDQGGISDAVKDPLRISGLAHILSISGLHMSLVTAALFGGARALLALIPPLALRYPVKKWAAALALAGAGAYLLVSGSSVPAERSAIMVAVMLAAVLVDRTAVSLRTVAIAALLVVAFAPEAVLDPGFQMSFAATIALVAGFEALQERRAARPAGPGARRGMTGWLVAAVLAAAVTSLLAGVATAPAAVYHFSRASPFSLVANLLAAPVVAVLVMPAALIAALAMPFGLEALPLKLMGLGIEFVTRIGTFVAGWTPGGGIVGQVPLAAVLATTAGGLWIALWRSPLRWAGLLPVLAGLAFMPFARVPDLVVSESGTRVLVHDASGRPALVGSGSGFEAEVWLQAMGIADDPAAYGPVPEMEAGCDDAGCVTLAWGSAGGDPIRVALVRRPEGFEDCLWADLVVTALDAPAWCRARARVTDAGELARTGTATYALGTDGRLDLIAAAVANPERRFRGG